MEESLEQRSNRERLLALLRRLPIREQELVALKYGAELTNREIVRVTGLRIECGHDPLTSGE